MALANFFINGRDFCESRNYLRLSFFVSREFFLINGEHFCLFQNSIFCLNPCVLCEYLNIKDLQKRRKGFDSQINPPPFFCLFSKGKKITKPKGFTSLREAQLHSKGAAFSSHLHSNRRFALLMKSLLAVACEEVGLRRPRSSSLPPLPRLRRTSRE